MAAASVPLRIAGVPEAFNDCWESAQFSAAGLTAAPEFIPHPGGSGAMLTSLQSGDVDAAFALTDCIVAAIENGTPVRILSPLVKSPLTWAVIVSATSSIRSLDDLSEATWGISRFGSGSHVMVKVLAKQQRWTTEPKFEVCGNFERLRAAVNNGNVQAFLWEHFTTRPFEENGEVRIIGGVPTPWGCFSVAVREDCGRIDEIGKLVDAFVQAGKEFLNEASVSGICERHKMSEPDARAWLAKVQYGGVGERTLTREELEMTRNVLADAGVIKELRMEDVESYFVKRC